ncbi:hypothetical protein DYY67_2340 [Candidatus Nitrosotalea sp. TS]|nr:hypothetical protein [Candidatus Nitrosotalea sp. TS]
MEKDFVSFPQLRLEPKERKKIAFKRVSEEGGGHRMLSNAIIKRLGRPQSNETE